MMRLLNSTMASPAECPETTDFGIRERSGSSPTQTSESRSEVDCATSSEKDRPVVIVTLASFALNFPTPVMTRFRIR